MISAPELGLFIVADGMGGHRGGETASAMVIEIVPQVVRKAQQQAQGNSWSPKNVIAHAISEASNAIHERATHDPGLQGMGTTTVAMLIKDNVLTIGHVGDSRCYILRPGAIWQATRDHSLVQEKLRAGLISRAELKTDRMKNVITRSVGFEAEVNVETYEMAIQPGDVFLICSDGLSGMVEDQQILAILEHGRDNSLELQQSVEQLIEAANRNGGDDNVSTIVVEVIQ